MVIFLNLDGSCENVTPQNVYQGSNNVTEIDVVAPFPSTTALQIGFILPDGLYLQSSAEDARYAPMELVPQETVTNINVWRYMLPKSVTANPGDVFIAINAVTAQGNTTSYLVKQVISESVLPERPTQPDPSVYDLLSLYIARLEARTANVANLVTSIQKSDGNSFTYTDNKGETSAPITLGVVDYSPTYIGAASVIELPTTAWQPVYNGAAVTSYTATVTAAQHGQMTDGATANDLWVSFDTTQSGVISGAYQGYTVTDEGDIVINVNTPIAMTVRVWNGKGLIDVTARADIAAEKARAEGAEADLQSQIDEIEQSGVDLTARARIAAETSRAETAEAQLQTEINGIRAVIPAAATAENKLADKAYVDDRTTFTQAQTDAINSGITAQKIADMDAATAAKYTLPATGIPESDLSEDVQTKLDTGGLTAATPTSIGGVYGETRDFVPPNEMTGWTHYGYNTVGSGQFSVAIGYTCAAKGEHDICIAPQGGYLATFSGPTGDNVIIGYVTKISGNGAQTGAKNVIIGSNITVYPATNTSPSGGTNMYLQNAIVISGAEETVYASANTIYLGNSDITTFNCHVSLTVTSDERDKTDITDIPPEKALAFINELTPIQYVHNDRSKYLLRETRTDENGNVSPDPDGENEKTYRRWGFCDYDREAHARGDKKGSRKRAGLRAQQVQQALIDVFGSDNYAAIVNDNFYDEPDRANIPVENHLSLSYERLVPFLIAAVKEQQAQIDRLCAEISEVKHDKV